MKQSTNNNQKRKCEGLSFWQSLRLWLSAVTQHSEIRERIRNAPVFQELAGVLIASKRATSNNRTYAALILFLVVAPLSEVAYQLLDKSAPVITWFEGQHWFDYQGNRVEGWYYKNFFWLFYQLSPHIQDLVIYTGAFCLIHKNDKRRWLAAIAMGFPFAKIIWIVQITSDAEIHQIVHWALLLIGVLIALWWIVLFEYLMNLHFHKREGSIARMLGILTAPGIDDSHRVEATCLWLKGLPPLQASEVVGPPPKDKKERYKWQNVWAASPGPEREKQRSKTFPGIAKAMAEQWGGIN